MESEQDAAVASGCSQGQLRKSAAAMEQLSGCN
jgi:hypothetical protein